MKFLIIFFFWAFTFEISVVLPRWCGNNKSVVLSIMSSFLLILLICDPRHSFAWDLHRTSLKKKWEKEEGKVRSSPGIPCSPQERCNDPITDSLSWNKIVPEMSSSGLGWVGRTRSVGVGHGWHSSAESCLAGGVSDRFDEGEIVHQALFISCVKFIDVQD